MLILCPLDSGVQIPPPTLFRPSGSEAEPPSGLPAAAERAAFPFLAARGGVLHDARDDLPMDDDLDSKSREQLVEEVKRLRAGIREHRDSSGQELCWHHPKLWALLPEDVAPAIAVPEWPQFMRGCIRYRESLDEQRPDAPRIREEPE